jgi:hypothetical protein
MGNVNVTRLGPEATNDNAAPGARYEYVDRRLEYRASPAPAVDFRALLVLAGVFVVFFVALAGVYFLFWRLPVCWGVYYGPCATARAAEPWAFAAILALPFLALIIYGALWASEKRARIAVTRAEAQRTAIVLDRWGMPVSAHLIHQAMTMQDWQAFVRSAEQTKVLTAPSEIYPVGLDALSISNAHHAGDMVQGEVVENITGLTPDDEWRKWLLKAPHLLVAGKTDAGKTTFQTMLLSEYIDNGDQVLILDPHWQPGKWFGLPVVDGIPAILDLLPSLITELTNRLEEYKRGKLTEEFDRLTILIDEVPAIVAKCIELTASGRPKLIDDRWSLFASKLGSEARKVAVRVILGSQSTDVQHLLISKQMRENYTRIALLPLARTLLAGETDNARKQALYDLLRGQSHPAAIEYRGEYYVLDTSNVVGLAERDVRSLARVWSPELATLPPGKAAPSASASVAATRDMDVLRASLSVPPQTDAKTDQQTEWTNEKKIAVLRQLRQAGLTRDEARVRLTRVGQGFNNDDWTRAGH